MAAVHSANEHSEVKCVFGTLLAIWKAFNYSAKKAEKLTEIEAELNIPELKVGKPSDTRWLARERCIRGVRRVLPALIQTFEEVYAESGDAEAYGLSKLLCTYKFVACLYMLCDVLHTVAKLQGSLQTKDLDLSVIPSMVESTLERLRELKDNPVSSTWFKDHSLVFSSPDHLGNLNVTVTESDRDSFIKSTYRPYLQSVIDHISSRMLSSDKVSAFSLFDPLHLPKEEEDLSTYGSEKLKTLINFYGRPQKITFESKTAVSTPDIDQDLMEAEWKVFRRLLFNKFKTNTAKDVIHALMSNSTLSSAFPNLTTLAKILSVIPVTTATVERSFSDMKLIKTRLRNRLGDETLDQAMRVSIEGPETLKEEHLEAILDHWKDCKPRRIAL